MYLVAKSGHPTTPLVTVHLGGFNDCVLQRSVIVRIYEDGVGQFVGSSGELKGSVWYR